MQGRRRDPTKLLVGREANVPFLAPHSVLALREKRRSLEDITILAGLFW